MNIPVSSPLIVATQPKPPSTIQTVSAVSLTNSNSSNSSVASSIQTGNSAIILSISNTDNSKPPTLTLTSTVGSATSTTPIEVLNSAFIKPNLPTNVKCFISNPQLTKPVGNHCSLQSSSANATVNLLRTTSTPPPTVNTTTPTLRAVKIQQQQPKDQQTGIDDASLLNARKIIRASTPTTTTSATLIATTTHQLSNNSNVNGTINSGNTNGNLKKLNIMNTSSSLGLAGGGATTTESPSSSSLSSSSSTGTTQYLNITSGTKLSNSNLVNLINFAATTAATTTTTNTASASTQAATSTMHHASNTPNSTIQFNAITRCTQSALPSSSSASSASLSSQQQQQQQQQQVPKLPNIVLATNGNNNPSSSSSQLNLTDTTTIKTTNSTTTTLSGHTLIANQHQQSRIIVSTAPMNTPVVVNSSNQPTSAIPRFITTVTTTTTSPTNSNLTIHQIALNNNNNNNSTNAQITQILSSTSTAAPTTTPTTTQQSSPAVNIKNLTNSKLSETLQLNAKSFIIDPKLTVNRTHTPTTASTPNPINYIKTTSLNSIQTQKLPTTATVLLNDAHMNAKAAQANLISIINTSSTSHQVINAPQVASIINQLRNQQLNIPTVSAQHSQFPATIATTTTTTTTTTTGASATQLLTPTGNQQQTSNQANLLLQSPSSSPLKPNIIRKTSKPLFDIQQASQQINADLKDMKYSAFELAMQPAFATQLGQWIAENNNNNNNNNSKQKSITIEYDNNNVVFDGQTKLDGAVLQQYQNELGNKTTYLINNQKAKKIVNIQKCNTTSQFISQLHTQGTLRIDTTGQNTVNQLIGMKQSNPLTISQTGSTMSNMLKPACVTVTNPTPPAPQPPPQTPTTATTTSTIANPDASPSNNTTFTDTSASLADTTTRKRRKQTFKPQINELMRSNSAPGTHTLSTMPNQNSTNKNLLSSTANYESKSKKHHDHMMDYNYEDDHRDDNDDMGNVDDMDNDANEYNREPDNNNDDDDASPPPNKKKFRPIKTLINNYKNSYSPAPSRNPNNKPNDSFKACSQNFLDDETVQTLSKEFVYFDKFGVKWIAKKAKPQFAIMKSYKPNWRARQNHFMNYADVKYKEEVKIEDDLLAEKEQLENLNEWRFHYIISQFKELVSYENDSLKRINDIEVLLKRNCKITDMHTKIHDTIQANAQRHKYLNEQFSEAQTLIQGLFQHKEKFKEILNTATNVLHSGTHAGNYTNSGNSASSRSNNTSNNFKLSNYLTNAQNKQLSTPSSNKLANNKKKNRTNSLAKRSNLRKKPDMMSKNGISTAKR